MLQRLLDESRAVSRRALRAGRQADMVEDVSLADRIAHIRACLAAIGEDRSPEAAESAAARLRLLVALSALPGGERRLSPRWPLAKAAVLRLASRDAAATLLDLGRGGALLAPVEGLRADQPLDAELVLGDDPAIPAIVATDSDRLVHLAFASGAMALTETLAREIRDLEAHYEAGLWQQAALANEVESLFGVALSDGVVAPDDLFSAGPAQERALSLRLEALTARALPLSDKLAYVAATDRNGFTICVPAERLGNGKAMTESGLSANPTVDAVTLRAARFSEKALVQTYRRRPGHEPLGVVADLSAPVFVRGRHWGCVRIGRALPKAAGV